MPSDRRPRPVAPPGPAAPPLGPLCVPLGSGRTIAALVARAVHRQPLAAGPVTVLVTGATHGTGHAALRSAVIDSLPEAMVEVRTPDVLDRPARPRPVRLPAPRLIVLDGGLVESCPTTGLWPVTLWLHAVEQPLWWRGADSWPVTAARGAVHRWAASVTTHDGGPVRTLLRRVPVLRHAAIRAALALARRRWGLTIAWRCRRPPGQPALAAAWRAARPAPGPRPPRSRAPQPR